jgi:hypothetical protein
MTAHRAPCPVSLLACCALSFACHARADDAAADIRLIDELLGMPVPAPDWRQQLASWIKEGWSPSKVNLVVPAEDALAERLAGFWSEIREPKKAGIDPPNAKVVARLIEHCEAFPGLFPDLNHWFDAKKPEIVARIRSWHAKIGTATEEQRKHKEAVHEWLMLEAGDFREELLARARMGLQKREEEKFLLWLRDHDWPAAKGLLLAAVESDIPAVRSHALRLLYKNEKPVTPESNALLESWRSALRQIVEGPGDAMVRARSLEALASPDWTGRADWIMTLFKDPALAEVGERYSRMEPLCAIVSAAPDYWIPRLVPLVGSRNRAEHDNAVRCLVQFHLERARADALKPLLPWLSDPAWASAAEDGRLRLIQSMDRVNLPESVPGLMWVAEHDDEFELSGAADALAHYKAKEAVPVLKSALSRTHDTYHRREVMRALIDLGGYDMQELCDGVVVFVAQNSTSEGRDEVYQSFDIHPPGEKVVPLKESVTLGMTVDSRDRLPDGLSRELHRKAQELRPTQAKLAAELDRLIVLSATPEAHSVIVDALRSGHADAGLFQAALHREKVARDALRDVSDLKLPGKMLQLLLSDDGHV